MPKNIVQDVLPPERKSIRDIPLPSGRRVVIPEKIYPQTQTRAGETEKPKKFNWKNPRVIIWSVAVLCVIVLFFVVSSMFSIATVEIWPRQQKFSVKTTLMAMKESSTTASSSLVYQVASVSGTAEKNILATSTENVSTKSSGTIVVYNNYSSVSQKLIKSTRFETASGLVYRITDPISVPGRVEKGGSTVPGSVEVVVYADLPGSKYNIGPSDFTVPGFKGDPRFVAIYARSKTPMQGGFIGARKKVSESARSGAKIDIENSLKSKLLGELRGQVPENFILYEGASEFSLGSLSEASSTDTGVTLKESGTISAAIFDRSLLNNFIVEKIMPNESLPVDLKNLESFVFLPQDGGGWTPLALSTTFSLSGDSMAVWVVNEGNLKNDLAGVSRGGFNTILSKYPQIEKARLVIRPFWKRSFPQNPQKIKVVEVLN